MKHIALMLAILSPTALYGCTYHFINNSQKNRTAHVTVKESGKDEQSFTVEPGKTYDIDTWAGNCLDYIKVRSTTATIQSTKQACCGATQICIWDSTGPNELEPYPQWVGTDCKQP